MGTKSRYLVKAHCLVRTEDLPELPEQLREDFEKKICGFIFVVDPHTCVGIPNHALHGELSGCKAVEIEYNDVVYRLVYHIYESPSPRRVEILSFAEHDAAYERATARVRAKRNR